MEHPADTHLNTCAVLSQIGRHQGALEHAQSALILLQEELFGGGRKVGTGGTGQPPRADRIAVLAIAYHNMGVEQEFLKKFEHSLQSYRKGVEVRGLFGGRPEIATSSSGRLHSLITSPDAILVARPSPRSFCWPRTYGVQVLPAETLFFFSRCSPA